MTAAAFRKFNAAQDEMARAAMPRVSAADPVPETPAPISLAKARWSLGRRFETKGAFTLGEAVGRA